MSRIKLSENFYLDEFTLSQVAARHGIEIVVEPGSDVFLNLQRLCRTFLQPIRNALGPVSISSGYRPPRVNRLAGGSKTSNHQYGLVADFTVAGYTPYEVCQFIQKSDLEFDQCIHEYGRWVHGGLCAANKTPRREVLTAYKKRSRLPLKRPKTVYLPGLHRMSEITKE